MLYPVYVHLGDETHAHGVTIPDFPGCFSAADRWEDLPANIQEAIEVWCEGEDIALPTPTSLESLIKQPDYQDGVWMLIDIDLARLPTRPVPVDVSLPEGLVQRMDDYIASRHLTRSSFLARAALREMQRET
ncbi:MAG: type II toxin-antitoxin system HicB family antitoxin [Candidatus Competibacteraceae bacterium]|nr:type II toxin-antitoxin system HicB family antitoxin [Candidatus Competibacteraceae bacterium]HRY15402.1 type II toxin-antitoxin system HicB family antitoxin [Candidatus Competibacteraceae bacterium]